MMIYNVTEALLQEALNTANQQFGGNLRFKTIERKGRTREGGERWSVTLTVFSTWRKVPGVVGERPLVKVTAPGVRVGYRDGRKTRTIAAACWHAHGAFFDALPEYVHTDDGSPCDVWPCQYLKDRVRVRIVTGRLVTHPGDPWSDFNIGSHVEPLMMSDACECSAFDEQVVAQTLATTAARNKTGRATEYGGLLKANVRR